jgi:prepilin-type processing-associated H-X9-DG protein
MRWLVIVTLVACGGTAAGGPDIDALIGLPVPAGCIDDVTSGDHVYSCEALMVDARIPEPCLAPGCGLILVLHGDTGNGLLMDGHVELRRRAEQAGYIVVAPTGPPFGQGFPGSTWRQQNDASLIAIVEQFRDVFRVDPKKIHVTGFSRGAFVTWRLLCDHADLFASAAPGGGGDGSGFGEVTCFSQGRTPARKLPIVFLMGRTDASVGYDSLTQIRDAAIADYGASGPTLIAGDAGYQHDRWTGAAVIETFDHAYETASDGPFASARGHCIPGSTTDPQATQYAIPCVLPNSFVWGEEVLSFFLAHPMP